MTTTKPPDSPSAARRFWGIDVAQRALHAVTIDQTGDLVRAEVLEPANLSRLVGDVHSDDIVAVDSPDRWSRARHHTDRDLPDKFRNARCPEIQLRAQFQYYVPWTTPMADEPHDAWMEVGVELHSRLREVAETVEVYPHACFLHLAGERTLPKKSSPVGLRVRSQLLAEKLGQRLSRELMLWSTDSLDALVAAVTARDFAHGAADVAKCGDHPDDGAIYLPA